MALPRMRVQSYHVWICSYDCEHRHRYYFTAWLCNRFHLWWL